MTRTRISERIAAGLLLIVLCAVANVIGTEWRAPVPPPAIDDAAHIAARLIPNPFAIETLLAQPNRAPVRVTAPYRVTVGGTAVQLTSSGNVNGGVCLKALVPGQTLYLGVSTAVTTSTGWPMSDNESLCLEVINANQIWGIASAAAQSVAVLPFSRY